MSGSSYPTLNTAIPAYNFMMDQLEDYVNDELNKNYCNECKVFEYY